MGIGVPTDSLTANIPNTRQTSFDTSAWFYILIYSDLNAAQMFNIM